MKAHVKSYRNFPKVAVKVAMVLVFAFIITSVQGCGQKVPLKPAPDRLEDTKAY